MSSWLLRDPIEEQLYLYMLEEWSQREDECPYPEYNIEEEEVILLEDLPYKVDREIIEWSKELEKQLRKKPIHKVDIKNIAFEVITPEDETKQGRIKYLWKSR